MKILHQREKEELGRLLSQNGNERSDDVIAVLDTFLSTEGHQTASDLQRRLKSRGLPFDQEFVQDTLELFCRYGFAQSKSFEGQENQYEHLHLGHHHDHLVCTRCGRVEEFIHPLVEHLLSVAAQDRQFIPLEHKLELYGLCKDCSRARGEAIPLCQAAKGEHVQVCGCLGGAELQRRMHEMGINNGSEVEILNTSDGPVVVACGGSRLALGRGMSEKVLVKPSEHTRGRSRHLRHGWRKHFKRRFR